MLSTRFFRLLACLALLTPAGGCSSDVNPVKAAFVDAGYGPKPVQTPDFVENSRREGAGYLAVGEDAPRRAARARSTEDRKSLEAELEGARSRNEARGRAAQSAAQGTGKGLRSD